MTVQSACVGWLRIVFLSGEELVMNKSFERSFVALALGLCLCLVAMLTGSPVSAQSTFGSLSGTVTDSSGSAIPDAQVVLTNLATGASQTLTTGGDGLYTFVNLNPGDYRLEVQKDGFKHYRREPVTVQVQQSFRIDPALEVGAVTQTVEVTGETPLLTPTTTTLGQVIEERATNEIPLNGRNVFNLITLSPGAIAQGGAGGTPVGQNPFSWGNYQVAGSFGNQSAEYLDGQPLNIGYINLPIFIPTQDSIAEFKVQYNNLGAEWGKFSGGIVNFSTKGGSNDYHGEAYEYLRNKVLNATPYNFSALTANPSPSVNPPYVQNQYGGNFGGHIIKDKTFFFVSWEQFRLRQGGNPVPSTVPSPAQLDGDFSALCPAGFDGSGKCTGLVSDPTHNIQLYNPYTATASGQRSIYPGNQIPNGVVGVGPSQLSHAAQVLAAKVYPAPQNAGNPNQFGENNFTANTSQGGNTNQVITRIDQNINSTTRLFGRFGYYGLTDLPTDPYGTGFCQDRCTELYHSKVLAIDLNHQFSASTIFDLNVAASRFVYARAPLNAGYDLTQLGWPASYNDVPSAFRTPPTPAFTFQNDVGISQGPGSAIGDHNSQYNFSPQMTLIRGKHTIQFGAQFEIGYDNYFQTNIGTGGFAFNGSWTSNNPKSPDGVSGFPLADYVLGLAQNQGHFVNQTEGVAQVPAQTAGKQAYRALFVADTWRITPKLTLNLGLRYELQGTWSERFDGLTYWDPKATNGTVTGCDGVIGDSCPGDIFLVTTGRNRSRNNMPLDKKEFSPRIGAAYSFDQKTVIRAGYGIFYVPNFVSFGLNPDNDLVSLANTPFTASTDQLVTPASTLDNSTCTQANPAAPSFTTFSCATPGPFASGIVLAPGKNAQPNVSTFAAANGNPTVAPYFSPKYGYVQQYNLDLQRQLPMGFFVDIAYAGSHGVNLAQYSTNINQIPDSFVAQAGAQCPGSNPSGCTPDIALPIANPLRGSPNAALNNVITPTIVAGQVDRPFAQYQNLNLAGRGGYGSGYNSLQATVTKRFQGGGTLLAAYTNAKLMSNTDTLTSWLESSTGGVGQIQDYNNLAGERSLSSQDVSQRLVVSYVYDLPFGHGQKYMGDASGVADKLVSGWGIDGITTFQKGFPLKITNGTTTPLEALNLGISNVRPNVDPTCNLSGPGGGKAARTAEFFNTSCFSAPPAYGYGTEPRVDASLRAQGINNWDLAIFKRTYFGPDNKLNLEFRTEFFNTFNRVQLGFPGTTFGSGGFGVINTQSNNPRLIQFGLKFAF
jgi:Carboxypeptidase regulatory-like domain